jgi:pimeloyl-[acyl-carrier protein] methyl ester esterase
MPPRVIMVPGWATDRRAWGVLALRLKTVEHRDWWTVLSDAPNGMSFSESCPTVLIGWSLGGLLALEAAAACPGGVAGLVLIAGTARLLADDGYAGVPAAEFRAICAHVQRGDLRPFFQACYAPGGNADAVAEACRRAASTPAEHLRAGLDALGSRDLRRDLPTLAMPTLVIHGARDAVVPVACAEYLAERMPQATLHTLPEAGHALPLTHGRELAALIVPFIRKLGG